MSGSERDQMVSKVASVENGKETVCLTPQLTLLNGITLIVGGVVGSGIVASPAAILMGTGSTNMALVVGTVSTLFSVIGAYCYAELGCMIPKTGGDYVYILKAFGPFPAFIKLWMECFIIRPCSLAIVGLTFSTYILKPFFPDCNPPDESIRLIAAWIICVLAAINCWKVKLAILIQDWCTYAKLLTLVVIIAAGGYQLFYLGRTEHFTWKGTETNPLGIAVSVFSGVTTCHKWGTVNIMIEEMKHPVRDLPRAIGISCILVTFAYFLTHVAIFTILSPAELMQSTSVAESFFERLFGFSYSWVFVVVIALSMIGVMNLLILTSSRLIYAGAMESQMPQALSMIQTSRKTPAPAVIFLALLSLVYLKYSNIVILINYLGFALLLNITLTVCCVPILRWKQPDLPRPVKVHLFWPIIFITGAVFITAVHMSSDPVTTVTGVVLIFTGTPVYVLCIVWKNKPKCVEILFRKATHILQKILIVQAPENAL